MLKKIVNLINLPLKSLRTDLGTQSRYLVTPPKQTSYRQILEHYADTMRQGNWRWEDSPPIVFGPIFHLGAEIYLPGDGHTRIEASRLVGFETILCDVRPGTAVDAVRYSIGPANRHYLTNKLDANDVAYRVHLALLDRIFWCWTDRRILDYCDDGNRLIKLRRVAQTRTNLLTQWQAENLDEYRWRQGILDKPDTLLDIDTTGAEFPTSHPRRGHRESRKVNPQDLSKLAYTTAQFRAAQVGCAVDRWIENAIILADRAMLSTAQPIGTLYTYRGDSIYCRIYNNLGELTELSATICAGYQLELLELEVSCPNELLPVRLVGCLWDVGLHIRVPISKLVWLVPPDA